MNNHLVASLEKMQKNELTEFIVYSELAKRAKNKHNQKILQNIALDEKKHADFWAKYTGQKTTSSLLLIFWYKLLAAMFGLTFAVKLMEQGEEKAQINYEKISQQIPQAKKIQSEEESHENALIDMLDEEKLRYISSIVLGLNDALVELTGTLAGLTLALQNPKLVAVTGLITGVSASFSMAASEYLSVRSENDQKNPMKSSVYTGVMYILTVLLLIFPYFIFNNIFISLVLALLNAILIILIFTYYTSIVQETSFKKRFFEMAGVSLGVSFFTFFIGLVVRNIFQIQI